MIHITITDTDTSETFFDRDCVAIVGGICMADKSAVELGYTRNGDRLTLAFATAAAAVSMRKVFKHNPDIADAIEYAFETEDAKGGDEE